MEFEDLKEGMHVQLKGTKSHGSSWEEWLSHPNIAGTPYKKGDIVCINTACRKTQIFFCGYGCFTPADFEPVPKTWKERYKR